MHNVQEKTCGLLHSVQCECMKTKPMKFWTRKAANEAVEECQRAGWPAGILGTQRPFMVQAITRNNGIRYTYDLHTDGKMHEYSRKEVAA